MKTMFYLQLRNELWKLFAKKRTYIGFLMFLLAQNVIILVFRFTNGPRVSMMRTLEGNGYLAQEFISALTVATFMLLPIAYMLLPLYVSLVGGDLVAKEAEDGTLRMILSRPISRLRLLLLKWLAGAIFSLFLVAALGLFGVVFASLWFPWSVIARDPAAIEDADAFDPDRSQANPHLGFALGAHMCLGQFIARAQLEEGLHQIARRLGNPRSPGPRGWRPFPGVWGIAGLPIEFDPHA